MSQQNRYITEHYSRLKYSEIKNLPRTMPSRPLLPEKPPKQYLVKFTPNPVEFFERQVSYPGVSQHSQFDTLEHSEHVKKHGLGFRESGTRQQISSEDNYENFGYDSRNRGGYIENRGYEQERQQQFGYDSRNRGQIEGNERRYYEEDLVRGSNLKYMEERPIRINVIPPPSNDFRQSSAILKNSLRQYESGEYFEEQAPRVIVDGFRESSALKKSHAKQHESVKRSGRDDFPEKAALITQIESLEIDVKRLREFEAENKRLRESMRAMELEANKTKGLVVENQRLNETVLQYRSSITNFAEMERQNRLLIDEIESLKRKLEEYEYRIGDQNEVENRIHEEYEGRIKSERMNYDKLRRDLEQMRGLEEKFFQMQAEKLSLEEEIEKIRVIKITLESQLERFRISYEEIEAEVTMRVRKDFEIALNEMSAKLDAMSRELNEKEVRMRATFDRELLEINAANRDLQEQLRVREERLKKSSNSDRLLVDLRTQLEGLRGEVERERGLRVELEVRFRNVNETNQSMRDEIDRLRIELTSRGSMSAEKERLMEQVVLELEKVNKALRVTQEEKEALKREKIDMETEKKAILLRMQDSEQHIERAKKSGFDQARRSLEEENHTLRREIDIVQIKCNDLSNKIKEYEQLVTNLRIELSIVEPLKNESNDLKVKLSESIKALTLLRQDFENILNRVRELEGKDRENININSENKKLIEQILMLSNELQHWKSRVGELEAVSIENVEKAKKAHFAQVNAEKHREIDDVRVRYEGQIESLRSEIARKDREISANSRYVNEINELRAIISRKEQEMAVLTMELTKKDRELSSNSRYVNEVNDLRGLLSRKDQEITVLKGEITKKDREIASSSRNYSEINELKAIISKKELEVAGLTSEIARKDRELVSNSRSLSEINELRLILSKKDQEISGLMAEIARKDKDFENSREHVKRAHLNQASEDKNKAMIELRTQYESQIRGLNSELDSIRNEIRRKDSEIEGLRNEIRRKESEIESMRVEIRKKGQIPQFNIDESTIRSKYEAQITSLEAKIMTLELERDEVRGKIESYLREIRVLQETNTRLEASFEGMRSNNGKNIEFLEILRENEGLKARILELNQIEIRMKTLENERNDEKFRMMSEIRGKEEIIAQVRREKEQIFAEAERLRTSFERQGINRMTVDSETLMKLENLESMRMENQTLKDRVEFMEKQMRRNDDDFSLKYSEFTRKIKELDDNNRLYREALQKMGLETGSNIVETSEIRKIGGSSGIFGSKTVEETAKRSSPGRVYKETIYEDRGTYYDKPFELKGSGMFRSTVDERKLENGRDYVEYRSTSQY